MTWNAKIGLNNSYQSDNLVISCGKVAVIYENCEHPRILIKVIINVNYDDHKIAISWKD